jgi:hypothetical protein
VEPTGGEPNILKIVPHRDAPIFSNESNPSLVLSQLISEIEGGHFTANDTLRAYFRQAGLVNLWFFAKLIAGYNGPFDKLNAALHVEMANFFQDAYVRGGKSAAYTGRGIFKSTIFTRGGIPWTIVRDSDIKWIIFSAIHERSVRQFMWIIQRIFDSNEFFAWLYPEFVPEKNAKRWNDEEMCVPNRTRFQAEPTVLPRGVCCSVQGLHGNVMVDDPVGDEQLNAERQSSADMYKTKNWLRSNLVTLTSGVERPFVFYAATRYAVDDAHSFMFDDVKAVEGDWEPEDLADIKIRPDGAWTIYNRITMKDGHSIAPDIISDIELRKIFKDDPWTAFTQYQNSPRRSGLSELNMYELPRCYLGMDAEAGWTISYQHDGRMKTIPLSSCDTVQAVDPGATEKYLSSKTSRTAVGVLAHAPDDRRFLLTCAAGFFTPSQTFDHMFSSGAKFNNYLRMTALETQGAFKILDPLLRDEIARRQKDAARSRATFFPINHRPVTKTGEKVATIRNALEPLLQKGLLYVEDLCWPVVWDELVAFPQSRRMDVLDMIALANKSSFRPDDEVEVEEREKEYDSFAHRTVNAAGY